MFNGGERTSQKCEWTSARKEIHLDPCNVFELARRSSCWYFIPFVH